MTETATARINGTAPVEETLRATEAAILDLVHGTAKVSRTLLPDAIARPTVTVAHLFDALERLLATSRHGAHSIAVFIESGFDGVERWAS